MMEILAFLGIIVLLISSQLIIDSVYKKYSRISANLAHTGKEISEMMLQTNGVNNVSFKLIKGELTDHYNSATKTISFSRKSCEGNSISSIAVAAHETGHALQDAKGYFMLKIRKILGPICSFASKFVWIVIFLGVILGAMNFILAGLALMAVTILFQIVTLPVEFDASRRAVSYLSTLGYDEETMHGVKKVLKAAAYTYLASTLASILELIRLFAAFNDD